MKKYNNIEAIDFADINTKIVGNIHDTEKTTKVKVIYLTDYISDDLTCLIGYELGFWLANEIGIRDIAPDECFVVKIPERIITMDKSFFNGFVGEKVVEFGQYHFKNKYIFHASKPILELIPQYIDSVIIKSYFDFV